MSAGYPSALAASLNETDDWEEAFSVWCLDEAPNIDFYAFTERPADWEVEFDEQCGEDDDNAYNWDKYQPRPLSQELEFDKECDLDFGDEHSDNKDGGDPVHKRRDWFSPAGMEDSYKIQDSDNVTSSMITIVPATTQYEEPSITEEDHQLEYLTEPTFSTQPALTEENLAEHDDQMPTQDSRNAISSIFDMIKQLETMNEQMAAKLASASHSVGNNEH